MFEFKPEDFDGEWIEPTKLGALEIIHPAVHVVKAAQIANAKLKEWLDKAPTVYGCRVLKDIGPLTWHTEPQVDDRHGINWSTRQAKLVCIEEIKP